MALKNIEDRFNQNYRYPWTFLNDEPFTDSFKLETARIASGEVQYGLIPKDHWSLPSFIDEHKFRESLKEMDDKKIIYGGSESYRHSQWPHTLSLPSPSPVAVQLTRRQKCADTIRASSGGASC